MEERSSTENLPKKDQGPSDLTIKRILAFSKALNSNKKVASKEEDQQHKN